MLINVLLFAVGALTLLGCVAASVVAFGPAALLIPGAGCGAGVATWGLLRDDGKPKK